MEKLHRFVNKSVATTGKMLSYDAKTFDLPKHYFFFNLMQWHSDIFMCDLSVMFYCIITYNTLTHECKHTRSKTW